MASIPRPSSIKEEWYDDYAADWDAYRESVGYDRQITWDQQNQWTDQWATARTQSDTISETEAALADKQAEIDAARAAEDARRAEEQAAADALAEKQRAEARVIGEGFRDDAYGKYNEAKTGSMKLAMEQDAKEGAIATMRGVDYQAGDSEKLAGWAGSFMEKAWTAENDTQMRDLFDEWGVPEGYTPGQNKAQAPGKGAKLPSVPPLGETILTEDDKDPLGESGILGLK